MPPHLPYKVLATYRPAKWRASIIGRDLTDITSEMGYVPHIDPAHGPLHLTGRNWCSEVLHAEVRRRTFKTQMAEGWHYDGDTTEGSRPNCLLCLWASNHPTEVKWRSEGKDSEMIYVPEPYQLVVFPNLECLHRRPPHVPRVRWVFRQRLALK